MTSNLDQILADSKGWNELLTAYRGNMLPQALSLVAPASMQEFVVLKLSKMLLQDGVSWKDDFHPDLIYAGKFLTQPSIDECRKIRGELDLYPLVSNKRLAVVWASDKLSLEASNSLLKVTEEPSKHGYIIFVSEEDKLIPTIKSRVWSIHIDLPPELIEAKPHPVSQKEWASWIGNGKKTTSEVLYLEIGTWIKELTEKGDYVLASELDSMIRFMEQKRLSVPMILDSVYAVLKEGVPCEQIFGSIWKA